MSKIQKNKKTVVSPLVINYPILNGFNAKHLIFQKWFQYLFLFILTFLIYSNTILHDYTLDDVIVITKNSFTQKGFAGIKDILTKDTFDGYTNVKNLVAGGRYRPLSVITFAIEIGLFGPGHPAIAHFINVLLYAFLIVLLFKFMKDHLFKNNPLLALLAALVFAIHPIHTEVVANIKSCDEIMATIFMIVSMQLFFDYRQKQNRKILFALSLFCFFLSLMSKESVLTYNAIIPLVFYFFKGKELKESIYKAFPFIAVTIVFLIMRFKITGLSASQNNDILNSPYLYASGVEAFATKVWVLLRYLWLLFFPYSLSYDYTYNQIPYVKIANVKFLMSLLINGGLIYYAFKTMKDRNIISFCILIYFIGISIASNFAFDIGAPMGERFLFHSSIGFSVFLSYSIFYFTEKINWNTLKLRRTIAGTFVALIAVLGIFKTVDRNFDWKNEDVLYIVDGKTSPNSAHATMNSAVSYVNLANKESDSTQKKIYFEKGISEFKKAIVIHPKFADAYINMGATYYMMKDVDNTAMAWEKAKELSPNHPLLVGYFSVLSNMCYNEGLKYYQQKNIAKAIAYYQQSLKYNDKNTDALYNLGGSYLSIGDLAKAREMWTKVLQIKPDHAEAKKWLNQISK